MAEKKQHKIVAAGSGEEVKAAPKAEVKTEEKKIKNAPEEKGNPTTLRLVAWLFWILAFATEIIAILFVFGKITITFLPQIWVLILFIVLDLAFVIIGAQFWKKANHIDPVSEANKLKFVLWNNMGVIVCCLAFVPFIIILLLNKNTDKKTKIIATIAAIVALLIGGVASVDWNPVSQEGLAQATQTLADQQVYWAPFGSVYHTHEDCQALNRTETLTQGTVDQALEANKTRLCKFCAKEDDLTVGENGAVIDNKATAIGEAVAEATELSPEEIVEIAEEIEDAAA